MVQLAVGCSHRQAGDRHRLAPTRLSPVLDLVDRINSTDGIVYVSEGQCGHKVRACLSSTMTMAGPNRVLRILIDPRKVDLEVMGSIGHELQHAVEVLSHHNIRSGGAMTSLYLLNSGCHCGDRFETYAAIVAGNAVRTELRDARLQSVAK